MVERSNAFSEPVLKVETLRVDDEVSVARIALRGLNKKTINHRSTTLYHVISGQGIMNVDGEIYVLTEGVIIEVPSETPYFDEGNVDMEAVSVPPYNLHDVEFIESRAEISIEARMSFIDRTQSNKVWINSKAIAEALGIYDRWVYRTVKELGIPSEIKNVDGTELAMYPPWTLDVLREELHWRQHIRDLPNELTIMEIAESLGRSRGWTEKNLEMIDIKPLRKGPRVKYGKGALKKLRHVSMEVPLDDGWFNLNQLVDFSSSDREWIINRLKEAGYEPMLRRSSLTGRVLDHYEPQAFDSLIAARSERANPAGDWVTVYAIAQALERNVKWVSARIGQFSKLAAPRQDDNGVTRIHYPPEVLRSLQEESIQIKLYPERGDYLNIHQVARRAGHATPWAEEVLNKLGIEPELRRDKKERLQSCYSPEVVNKLVEYERDNPQEKSITLEDLWLARVVVGSLRSKIRMKRKIDAALVQHGVPKSDNERQQLVTEITMLKKELKPAQLRLYRLEDKASGQMLSGQEESE